MFIFSVIVIVSIKACYANQTQVAVMIDSGINVSGLSVYLKSTTTYLKSITRMMLTTNNIQVELTKKVDGFSSAILT